MAIATHNRRDLLRRCLDSLAGQTQDPDTFEVIVADDGSTDGTAEMVEQIDTPFRLRVLRFEKSGQAILQNALTEAAEAPVCLFLDDDVIASPELVSEHLAAHRSNPVAIGIGALTQKPFDGRDWYADAFARGWNEHYEERAQRPATWTDCAGANLSIPREMLIEVGGVSTDLPAGNHLDLAFRLCRAGGVPTYLPRAHGVHDDQKRRRRMLENAQEQGAAHVTVSRRFPAMAPRLLGRFRDGSQREIALRRLLIALHVPPTPLASIGRLIPGDGRKMIWFHFVRKFTFWQAVRRNVSRHEWERVTRQDGRLPPDANLAPGTE